MGIVEIALVVCCIGAVWAILIATNKGEECENLQREIERLKMDISKLKEKN